MRKRAPLSVYFVAGLLILATVGYVINMARSHLTPVIPTEVVRMGTITAPHTIPAIVIRDERVYYAPRAGRLVFAVGESERVRMGTHVASIQDANEVARILHDMRALEQRGLDIGEMRDAQNDPNVIRINNHIRDQLDTRAQSFTSLNFAELYVLRDNLNHSIDSRNQHIINGSLQAGGDYIHQQAELDAQMVVHSSPIFAQYGGIMTSAIDGLEGDFTIENIPMLTRDQFNSTPDPFPSVPAQYLEANASAFKIVSNVWYIAAYIPNNLIQGASAGQTRYIYVESPITGEYLRMNVRIHQITPGTTDSRVVFRNTRYVIDFMHVRNVNIRMTQRVEEGLVIPNTAITSREYVIVPSTFVHGPKHSVLRYTSGASVTIPVTISEIIGAQTHIMGDLRVGDVLLDGLGERFTVTDTDVHVVQGIFWANYGYARFRPIFTDELITDRAGTTLLDARRNQRSLLEFDNIIVDANMVNEGDLIW